MSRKSRERREKNKTVRPDDYFSNGTFEMARFGKNTIVRNNRTPEQPLLDKTRSEFELSYNMNTLKSEIECISEIAHIVSGSLKGNPRQTKRFLNTFYVRKSLAALYFGEEIHESKNLKKWNRQRIKTVYIVCN